jgi:hypothetical protein
MLLQKGLLQRTVLPGTLSSALRPLKGRQLAFSVKTGAAKALNELQIFDSTSRCQLQEPPAIFPWLKFTARVPNCYTQLLFREEDTGNLLHESLGTERLALMEQRLPVGSQDLVLVEPADVDAVMDMYIHRGASSNLLWPPEPCAHI